MQQLLDSPTRVLVLHAEAIFGFGLAAALAAQAGFEVQLGAMPEASHTHGGFDVVVCDYDTGLGLAQAARQQSPQRSAARLLLMTAQDRERPCAGYWNLVCTATCCKAARLTSSSPVYARWRAASAS